MKRQDEKLFTDDTLFVNPTDELQGEIDRILEVWTEQIAQAQLCAVHEKQTDNPQSYRAALSALAVESMRVRMSPSGLRQLAVKEFNDALKQASDWAKIQKWITRVLDERCNALAKILHELPEVPEVSNVKFGKPQLVQSNTLDDAEIAEDRSRRVEILQQLDAVMLAYAALGKIASTIVDTAIPEVPTANNEQAPEALVNLTRATLTCGEKFTDLPLYLSAMRALCAPRIFVSDRLREPHPQFSKSFEACVSAASLWIRIFARHALRAQEQNEFNHSEQGEIMNTADQTSDFTLLIPNSVQSGDEARRYLLAAHHGHAPTGVLRWKAHRSTHVAVAALSGSKELEIEFTTSNKKPPQKFHGATVHWLGNASSVDGSKVRVQSDKHITKLDKADAMLLVDGKPWWLQVD